VIFDAHEGLKTTIASVMLGASWQRCRVHLLRNALAGPPKGNADVIAVEIRSIVAPFA
jgi:putative transposase